MPQTRQPHAPGQRRAGRGYDAYLITGSKADSFGTDPWIQTLREFLLERYDNGDRLIGICFGHQLLALLLGGKTERAAQGWGIGVNRYAVLEQPEWMSPSLEHLDMLVFHQDQVTELPAGATYYLRYDELSPPPHDDSLAASGDGPLQLVSEQAALGELTRSQRVKPFARIAANGEAHVRRSQRSFWRSVGDALDKIGI